MAAHAARITKICRSLRETLFIDSRGTIEPVVGTNFSI